MVFFSRKPLKIALLLVQERNTVCTVVGIFEVK